VNHGCSSFAAEQGEVYIFAGKDNYPVSDFGEVCGIAAIQPCPGKLVGAPIEYVQRRCMSSKCLYDLPVPRDSVIKLIARSSFGLINKEQLMVSTNSSGQKYLPKTCVRKHKNATCF